jgi:aspartate/methionine/tyrosine aminotransferase
LDLRERIAAFAGGGPENVLVTSGTIEANFLAAWRLLEPGDEVVYLVPNYLQIGGLAEGFGAAVRPFTLREDLGWQPDLDELGSLVTPGTRMIAAVNPNNPTGVLLTEASRRRLIDLAAEVGAWLVVDEIYRGTEHDGRAAPTCFGEYERTIVTGSLSKAFGLPGLRVGWVIGPEPLVYELWGYKDYTSITCASLSYALAERALRPEMIESILTRNRAHVLGNLEILRAWAAETPGVHLTPPNAGAMALLRYEHPIGSVELTTRFHHDHSVLVLPGAYFGMEQHLRIGYGIETDRLQAALDLMAGALAGIE